MNFKTTLGLDASLLCEDGGDLRYWALVGYTPRGPQVVQCSGWRQRCGLDRVDDCSYGRQQGADPGEQRADSFHLVRMLLVSQDMKHTSPATFSHGVVLSINESTSCRKSSMRK